MRTTERLKKRRQFLALTHQGRRIVGTGLVMQYLPNRLPAARVGFTITKKIGGAVVRNRIRRRLREAVRLSAGFAALGGCDIAIIARRDILEMTFDQIRAELEKMVRQIK
ncbi:MAG: ribonuclease P protein component [Alphaproteobacteria bacterium]|nr:ribonuclease P protein component [Alphaproteobacteria bacterium]